MARLDLLAAKGGTPRRLRVASATAPERRRLAALPGASVLGGTDGREVVSLPLDPYRAADARAICGADLVVSDEVADWTRTRAEFNRRSLRLKTGDAGDDPPPALPLYDMLYPYQRVGVRWLRFVTRAILGDEMGLGKTLQTLAASSESARTLIVTVNLAKRSVWESHIARFFPARPVFVADGDGAARVATLAAFRASATGGYLVINHEMLQTRFAAKYRDLYGVAWDCVILDEAHKFQDAGSSQSKGAAALVTKRLYLATGTAVWNRPESIFGLLRLLDPVRWSSYWTFVGEYCDVAVTHWGREIVGLKPDKMDQLKGVLAPLLLARKVADVLPDLPPKRVSTLRYDLTPLQRRAYGELKRKYRVSLEDGTVLFNEPNQSKMFADLRRVVNSPRLVGLPDEGTKTALIDELLDNALSEGKKVVVFTWHHDYTEFLSQHLAFRGVNHRTIMGGSSAKEGRADALNEFRDDPDVTVLLAGIAAAGVAIDLTVANVAIFAEGSYIATQVAQAEARLHRIGQRSDVMVYRLAASRTVEDALWETVENRDAQANEMTALANVVRRMLADAD